MYREVNGKDNWLLACFFLHKKTKMFTFSAWNQIFRLPSFPQYSQPFCRIHLCARADAASMNQTPTLEALQSAHAVWSRARPCTCTMRPPQIVSLGPCVFWALCAVAGARPVRGRRVRHPDDAVQGRSAEGGLDAGHSRGALQVVHQSGDQEPARGVHHEPVVRGAEGQSGHLTCPLQQVRLAHAIIHTFHAFDQFMLSLALKPMTLLLGMHDMIMALNVNIGIGPMMALNVNIGIGPMMALNVNIGIGPMMA